MQQEYVESCQRYVVWPFELLAVSPTVKARCVILSLLASLSLSTALRIVE